MQTYRFEVLVDYPRLQGTADDMAAQVLLALDEAETETDSVLGRRVGGTDLVSIAITCRVADDEAARVLSAALPSRMLGRSADVVSLRTGRGRSRRFL